MLNKVNTKTSILLALICFVSALLIDQLNKPSSEELKQKAEKHLRAKENRAQERLGLMVKMLKTNNPSQLFSLYEGNITELYDKEKIALFVFEKDSLRFWTTSQVPLQDMSLSFVEEENGIKHLRNGWYEFFYKRAGKYDALCFILIKPDYDVQNNYLSNSFADWLLLPPTARIKSPATHPEKTITSILNKPLFEVETYEVSELNTARSYVAVFLFLAGLLSIILVIFKSLQQSGFSIAKFVLLALVIVGVRIIMIWFKWPGLLYRNELFDAATYGNTKSFFNELLGDILLNVSLFFIFTVVFVRNITVSFYNRRLRILLLNAFAAILMILAVQLSSTIESFVSNSTISFEFSNFFNLNSLSFLCLFIVFINGLSISLLTDKFISLLGVESDKIKKLFIALLTVAFVALYFFFRRSFTVTEWFWYPVFFLLSLMVTRYSKRSMISIGVRLMFFSLVVSSLFTYYNSLNEEKNLKFLSHQLLDKQDPILENSFAERAEKIKKDAQLQDELNKIPLAAAQAEQRIRQSYLTGYFEKYTIQLALFDSLCMPYFKNSDLAMSNNEFFENYIANAVPARENLFFVDEHNGSSFYIGKIEFGKKNEHKAAYTLYATLIPKQLAGEGSFPDLLLDKSQQKQSKYKQFSYGLYKNGKLVSTYGDFDDYPLYYGANPSFSNLHSDYLHHFYSSEEGSFVILSTKARDLKYYFTINSYYFLFFLIAGFILLILYSLINKKPLYFFSLSRRIQLFNISILFFALLAVGIFSIRLVSQKFSEDNVKLLSDKAKRLSAELSAVLFNMQNLEINSKGYAESVLKKYAYLFNSDISIYNEKGYLFASSQPQLFETGLSSNLINPSAVYNFKKNQSSYFHTTERVGSLKYISLYTAAFNPRGKFLGYINLPYFARQSNLEEQLSDYVSTLLNIYVVLFLLSLLTGLIVTSYITKPLRIVQDQLAKITLGQKNEPISWQSNDEIGKLVNEYNKMISKLEESAELLARSEREGAWREMAKQVAHEIKNPLTPMKLNLQYLQKLATDEQTDFKMKFKTVSASIIEQIDTLAYIANEFSNFAKISKGEEMILDIREIINSSLELFRTTEDVKFELDAPDGKMKILGDKNQLLRVFNNLVKNAVQAIPEGRQGLVRINIKEESEFILVTIEDNGCGISEAMREKIFVPNFTTKSTGTGLGLAMVKNIITSMGGSIRFESAEQAGTVFYIKFPKADRN